MPASSYLIGRRLGKVSQVLNDGQDVADLLFAAQRLDGTNLSGVTFRHCTFANISFKDCVVEDMAFVDCVFVDCYFRGTLLKQSKFEACKFIDCDFTKIDLRSNDFRYYNHFKGCWLPRRALEHGGLPTEPNLKHHLCANLSDEARLAGALKDAEWYRQAGVKAKEAHLFAAMFHLSPYYKEKFQGTEWVSAYVDYIASRARGWLGATREATKSCFETGPL
ncbi:pentapeptide repeat-containing protein [Micromonospora sp. IBSANI012]|uniref:pentapeptide repeat-containing protein n=1 Tax=Micromonospora sp. IBSANI012 TaxID=3457761 RepID=UPI004058EF38